MNDEHDDFLRLLIAVIDDDDVQAHAILDRVNPTAFAHFCAHKLVAAFSVAGKDELRKDIVRDLMENSHV